MILRERFAVTKVRPKMPDGYKPPRWNRYNLIPTSEEFGAHIGEEYREKMLALEVAGGRSDEYRRLYESVDPVTVYEIDLLQRAHDFHS